MQQPNAFTTLRILHTSLLISMAMFSVVSLVLVQEKLVTAPDESFQRIFQVVCVLASALFLFAGLKIFKKKMLAARNDLGAGEKKMEMYRAACILWWAMIEGPGLLAGIGFILTTNYAFFALIVFHLLCLLMFTPRKANIVVLLNLNADEVARIEGKL